MGNISFPYLGNSKIMALVISVHVFFAFFAVGGLTMAVFLEWLGMRKPEPVYVAFSKRLNHFLADMMKINGVLGVAIIVLLIGLWGKFTVELYSITFWTFVAEGMGFLFLMIFSIAYRRSYEHRNRSVHFFYGCMAVFAAVISAFFINAIWAFMLMPGKWLVTKNRWDAFFNPIMVESSIHLIVPCLLNALVFLFLWTLYKERKTKDGSYQKLNALFANMLANLVIIQPISGVSFLLKVRRAGEQYLGSPKPYDQIIDGVATPFFYAMISLAAIAVFATIPYRTLGHAKGRKFLIITSIALCSAFFMGAYTRERARKPFLIHSYMYMNMKTVAGVAESKPINSGLSVYEAFGCATCHKLKGSGGTFGPVLDGVADKYTPETLPLFLRNPTSDVMPKFEGSDAEIGSLVQFLLSKDK